MAVGWFYIEGRVRRGPVSLEELLGVILMAGMEETLVWREGQSSWIPASKVSELTAHFPPPPPPEARVDSARPTLAASASVVPTDAATGQGEAARAVRAGGAEAPERRMVEYRNDNEARFCNLLLDDGEHVRAEYLIAEGAPTIFVGRMSDGWSKVRDVLWSLEWTPENVELFCELFGEPPELPRPAVGIFAAVAEKLSDFQTLHEMRAYLGGTSRRAVSGDFFRAAARYLRERTAKGVDAASAGYELAQAAGSPGLDEQALGVALATAASEPGAAYSPEAVEAALRIVKDVTDRRNMRPDYFLVLEALEDGFKDAERRGDEAPGQQLRELFALVRDVLVSGEGGLGKAEPPVAVVTEEGVFVPGVFRISTDGGNRYVRRVAESGGIQSALCSVPVDADVCFEVAASRSQAFASGVMVESMSRSYSLANGSSYSLWEFEDGSYASRLSPPRCARRNE